MKPLTDAAIWHSFGSARHAGIQNGIIYLPEMELELASDEGGGREGGKKIGATDGLESTLEWDDAQCFAVI